MLPCSLRMCVDAQFKPRSTTQVLQLLSPGLRSPHEQLCYHGSSQSLVRVSDDSKQYGSPQGIPVGGRGSRGDNRATGHLNNVSPSIGHPHTLNNKEEEYKKASGVFKRLCLCPYSATTHVTHSRVSLSHMLDALRLCKTLP